MDSHHSPPRPQWRGAAARLSVAAALVAAIACHDTLTAPAGSGRLHPSPRRSSLSGLFPIPTPPNNDVNDGAVPWTSTGIMMKPWTSYIVRVTGAISVTSKSNPCGQTGPFGMDGTYGPAGTDYNQLRVQLGWEAGGGINNIYYGSLSATEVWTDTIFNWTGGELKVQRAGVYGAVGGGTPYCYSGLYDLTGGEMVSVEVFDDQEIEVTPSGLFRVGTWVPFKGTSRGEPLDWMNSMFIKDPADSSAGTTSACGTMGANPCWVQVNNNGELRISRDTRGRMRSASAPVRVYTNFTLEADRQSIRAGDSVTFTPRADGKPGMASRWRWQPDGGTAVLDPCGTTIDFACIARPTQSGSMWAYSASGDSASAHVDVAISPPDSGGCGSTLLSSFGAGALLTCGDSTGGDDSAPLTVSATCKPAVLTRGDTVTCVARVSPRRAYKLLEQRAVLENYRIADTNGVLQQVKTWTVADSSQRDERIAAGDTVVWKGPAVATSTVTFTVVSTLAGSTPVTSAPVQFTVQARTWEPYRMPEALPPYTYSSTALRYPYPGIYVAPPGSGLRDTFPRGGLGENSWAVHSQEGPARLMASGPNAGVLYLARPPQVGPEEVTIASSLDPNNAFFQRQDSAQAKRDTLYKKPPGGPKYKYEPSPAPYPRYCVKSDMETLRAQVLAHEGSIAGDPQNHHSVNVQYLRDHNLMQALEDVWAPLQDESLGMLGTLLWKGLEANKFWAGWKVPQDYVDNHSSIQPLNCKLRP